MSEKNATLQNVMLPVTIQLKGGETVELKANTDIEKIGAKYSGGPCARSCKAGYLSYRTRGFEL